jgi:hypothetical protein
MTHTIYQVHTVREADGTTHLPDFPFDYLAVRKGQEPETVAKEYLGEMYPGYTLCLTKTDLTYREYTARTERLYHDKLRELLA